MHGLKTEVLCQHMAKLQRQVTLSFLQDADKVNSAHEKFDV